MCDTHGGKGDSVIGRHIRIAKVAFQELCNIFSDIKYLPNKRKLCTAM